MTSLEAATAAGNGVRFVGDPRVYWRLLVRGGLLLAATLGIYRFWLTTDVRRFLWANTEVAGESLEYTGKPLELLLGFLVAIAILIPVYTGFFMAALDLGPLGKISGVIAFGALGVLGQYAVYRARRYRLTRTIYRGVRFHQSGSAWRYAFCAVFWWSLTALSCGLAYPLQLASLERYKMRNTYYGDLAGSFAGSGFGLLLRGFPMWFLVVAPLAVAAGAMIDIVDWQALARALEQGGRDVMGRIERGNPELAGAIVFAMLMVSLSAVAAALLYPAFQALVLRWWSSGLRFGEIEMCSNLSTRQIYGAYVRFLWYAILFGIGLAVIGVPVLLAVGAVAGDDHGGTGPEIAATGLMLAGYVIAALGFSTIYRATVMLSLWRLGMESLQMSGLSALDRVKASGGPSSPLGEGLADALNVGGY